MFAVSCLAFLLTALVGLEIFIRKSDFFSPARIFLLAQSVALGVAFLALDREMTPFRPFTTLIYLGGGACFLLGLCAIRLTVGKHPTARVPLDWEGYNWNLHLVFTLALLAFAVFGLWGAQSGAGGFPLLAHDKIRVHRLFLKQSVYFMFPFSFSGIVMSMLFMGVVRPRAIPLWRRPSLWIIITTFLFFSLALSRVSLIFFVFFAMVFYHQARRRLSLPKLLGVFSLCFVLVLVTGYFKAKQLEERTSVDFKKIAGVAFKIPYLYLANNFWNLDHALNPTAGYAGHRRTYGFTMAQGFLDFPIGLAYHIRKDAQIDDQFNTSASKHRGLNTITYHWTLYKDFGMPGVFLGSFLIGLLLGAVYAKVRRRPTMLTVAAYSYLAFFIANAVFGFFSESSAYFWGFFYVCVCCYACQTVRPKVPATPVSAA